MPSNATLRKYGLSAAEWQSIYDGQNGLCPICEKPLTRACVDHKHVRGWKTMPPDERKKFVRGLLCFICNFRILTRGVTVEKLERAAAYLRKYEEENTDNNSSNIGG